MADAAMDYKEIRFVIEDELTEVYVLIYAKGDCPIGVQGWHHKTYPASLSVDKILEKMFTEKGGPLMWPLDAPQGI